MKKFIVAIVLVVVLFGCGSKTDKDKPQMDTTPAESQTNNSVDILVDTLGFKADSANVQK